MLSLTFAGVPGLSLPISECIQRELKTIGSRVVVLVGLSFLVARSLFVCREFREKNVSYLKDLHNASLSRLALSAAPKSSVLLALRTGCGERRRKGFAN